MNMAIPTNKEELLAAIKSDFRKLNMELSTIPENISDLKELEGHAKNSSISIKDLVSYLVGWGQLVLKWNKGMDAGMAVDFPETGYKWNELGKLAQKFYLDYEAYSFGELVAELTKTVDQIVHVVEQKSNDQLYSATWYEHWTAGRLIQLNTSSPYKNAIARIRKWKKVKGLR